MIPERSLYHHCAKPDSSRKNGSVTATWRNVTKAELVADCLRQKTIRLSFQLLSCTGNPANRKSIGRISFETGMVK